MTHTPSPWIVAPWGDGSSLPGNVNIIAPDSEVIIASDVLKQEAPVLAAAPELLAALKELVEWPTAEKWLRARVAINMAEREIE